MSDAVAIAHFLSLTCARSSARIERLVAVQKVVGSNPAGRTIKLHERKPTVSSHGLSFP